MNETNKDDYRSIQRKLSKESPSQLLRMISRLPKTSSILKSPIETNTIKEPSIPTITPYVPKAIHNDLVYKTIDKRQKFMAQDIEEFSNHKVEINLYKRKHRHLEDMDDTLSVISHHSTKSYSRFDRVFQIEKFPATQDLIKDQDSNFIISSLDRAKLQRTLDIQQGIDTQSQAMNEDNDQNSSFIISSLDKIQLQKTLDNQQGISTQSQTSNKSDHENVDIPLDVEQASIVSTESKALEQEIPSPIVDDDLLEQEIEETASLGIPNILNDDLDDNAMDYEIEEMETDHKPIEREKIVVPGNSFIRNRMREPIERHKLQLIIPHARSKSLFKSYLGFNKTLKGSTDLSRATTLFCDQLVDDLKSYKENQPLEQQDEITEDDVLLLLQRQRLISDKASLEALVQKYLPREYVDILCQSSLAYNELYPNDIVDQTKAKDQFYYKFKDSKHEKHEEDEEDDVYE